MSPALEGDARKRLMVEVRALGGAQLQKLWLPSAQLCVLQLRLPGETVLVVLDARLAVAAISERRPTSPESAPRSQATLRAALEGATLSGAHLQIAEDRRALSARLEFGSRSLVAEEDGALLLLQGERIVWAASGAGARRRPGGIYPATREVELGEPAPLLDRETLLRAALQGEEEAGLAARKKELAARLKSQVQKLRRTLAAVEEDAARAGSAAEDLHKAELLLPQQSRIPRGAREARLQDWSRIDEEGKPAEVVVALDPSLSAAANAARWLRKAKRYQAAGARIAGRREEVAAELARAEENLARTSAAQDAAQLAEVELSLPAKARRARTPKAERLPYRRFRSQSGVPILVGRSARDNDALTFRVARGNDVWLHARGLQGAHIVLPGAGDAPDARALGDAALLAAHFSSARGKGGAEVAWTRVKHVRKPRGAKPGAVTISQEKTLRVRLEEERLAALLRSEE